MNENNIQKLLNDKILTYNDLDEEEFEIYKSKFHRKHKEYENSFAMKNILTDILHFVSYKKINIFVSKTTKMEDTRFRMSCKIFQIPSDLNQIMEYFLSRNLVVEGLFKKSAHYESVQNALRDFTHCIENEINLNEKMKHYDLLVLSSVFKESLNMNENTIIPIEYAKYLCNLKRANITESDKILALRYLILNLPLQNLNALQSVIVFLKIIHQIASISTSEKIKQISFAGFTSVVTPRLVLGKKTIDLDDLRDLSDIMIFVAENFEKIITICEIY